MRVSIIGGTGYVGLVTGIGLAAKGHKVICADIDAGKVEGLKNGKLPIYEAGLAELLHKAKKEKRISFTSCLKTAVVESDIIMIAVGTPERKNGETDISQLLMALKTIARYMDSYKIIAVKSTIPVGTCEMADSFVRSHLIHSGIDFDVVSNPEFLREGSAVMDFMYPERVIIGADAEKAGAVMEKLYKSFDAPIISTDRRSAEMIKYACNTYLAARISFINEIAEICEKVGADINAVIAGMKPDKRIGGSYLSPGPGFGGPCLSKDLKSLIRFGSKANADLSVLKAVLNRNDVQIRNIIDYIADELKLTGGKRVAILGLSFKAGTNDTRNSPAIRLIEKLVKTKIEIAVYDPVVKQIDKALSSRVIFCDSIDEAADKADCLAVMTEWDAFKSMDLEKLFKLMRTPVIYDARNIIPVEKAASIGYKYKGIGIQSKPLEIKQEHAL